MSKEIGQLSSELTAILLGSDLLSKDNNQKKDPFIDNDIKKPQPSNNTQLFLEQGLIGLLKQYMKPKERIVTNPDDQEFVIKTKKQRINMNPDDDDDNDPSSSDSDDDDDWEQDWVSDSDSDDESQNSDDELIDNNNDGQQRQRRRISKTEYLVKLLKILTNEQAWQLYETFDSIYQYLTGKKKKTIVDPKDIIEDYDGGNNPSKKTIPDDIKTKDFEVKNNTVIDDYEDIPQEELQQNKIIADEIQKNIPKQCKPFIYYDDSGQRKAIIICSYGDVYNYEDDQLLQQYK